MLSTEVLKMKLFIRKTPNILRLWFSFLVEPQKVFCDRKALSVNNRRSESILSHGEHQEFFPLHSVHYLELFPKFINSNYGGILEVQLPIADVEKDFKDQQKLLYLWETSFSLLFSHRKYSSLICIDFHFY